MTATIPSPNVVKPAPERAGTNGTERWSIAAARNLYNIEGWGVGYFDITPVVDIESLSNFAGGEGDSEFQSSIVPEARAVNRAALAFPPAN